MLKLYFLLFLADIYLFKVIMITLEKQSFLMFYYADLELLNARCICVHVFTGINISFFQKLA